MRQKFSINELEFLGNNLLNSSWDSFQRAQAIKLFVAEYGYGISLEMALSIGRSLTWTGGSLGDFSSQIENLALAM